MTITGNPRFNSKWKVEDKRTSVQLYPNVIKIGLKDFRLNGATKNRGGFFIFDMQAYRFHKIVIAADTAEEACDFYREEIGGTLP